MSPQLWLGPKPQLIVPPQLWLDPLLPRLVELAEQSTLRPVRVAACELLHGLVLWMVGSNARRPREDGDAGEWGVRWWW